MWMAPRVPSVAPSSVFRGSSAAPICVRGPLCSRSRNPERSLWELLPGSAVCVSTDRGRASLRCPSCSRGWDGDLLEQCGAELMGGERERELCGRCEGTEGHSVRSCIMESGTAGGGSAVLWGLRALPLPGFVVQLQLCHGQPCPGNSVSLPAFTYKFLLQKREPWGATLGGTAVRAPSLHADVLCCKDGSEQWRRKQRLT